MKFTDLPLIDELQVALKKKGYYDATPIQKRAIPVILKGKDVLGVAQTGTGKTAAFALPLLHLLAEKTKEVPPHHVRVLILAPTRELASQIDKTIKGYARQLKFRHACIFGGTRQKPQETKLEKGVDILVATPGRLLDLYRQQLVSLHNVEYFVLDEADRMLDMGFIPDVKAIFSEMGNLKQRSMFSATMSPAIDPLIRQFLKSPIRIEVDLDSVTVDAVRQSVLFVDQGHKNSLLVSLLQKPQLEHVLIFTRTKARADQLDKALKKEGIKCGVIHGDKAQGIRTQTLASFRRKKTRVLIATEIAARGLDVNDISHVINFDVPSEPESYIHRIGRTARAGAKGNSYLFCTAKEKFLLSNIQRAIGKKLHVMQHPYHSDYAQAVRKDAPPSARGTRRTQRAQTIVSDSKRTSAKKTSTQRSTDAEPRKEMKRWGKNRRDEGRPLRSPRPKK